MLSMLTKLLCKAPTAAAKAAAITQGLQVEATRAPLEPGTPYRIPTRYGVYGVMLKDDRICILGGNPGALKKGEAAALERLLAQKTEWRAV